MPAVAEFAARTLESSNRFEYRLISLATAARDEIGVSLTRPTSLVRGVRCEEEVWRGRPFVRVGAFLSELEFQRYRPRGALADLLAHCDVIQVVCGSPAWALAVCGLGKPVAVHCATLAAVERRRANTLGHGPKARWQRRMTQVTAHLDERALRSVDAIQVMNPWMMVHAHKANVRREVLISFAPPGVDAARFCPAATRDLETDRYILCVGRLDDPRKNIDLLLEAYAMVQSCRRGPVRLVLAGLAGPPPPFWARVQSLGLEDRVVFVHAPDSEMLIRLYQGASVFALPSDEEGFGMVVLEAMACGIPVVSTRSGGPDGIISDGEDGYLVPLDDAGGLADRIARLCQDVGLNRAMGRRARATIEQRYAEEVAGQAFLDIWDRLLHRAGKA